MADAKVTVVSLEDTPFELPNLANATPEFLTQELGKVKSRIKNLEKYEGVFEQALVARLKKVSGDDSGKVEFDFGEHKFFTEHGIPLKYAAKLEFAKGQVRLNSDKVRAYVGDTKYLELSAETNSKGYKLTIVET